MSVPAADNSDINQADNSQQQDCSDSRSNASAQDPAEFLEALDQPLEILSEPAFEILSHLVPHLAAVRENQNTLIQRCDTILGCLFMQRAMLNSAFANMNANARLFNSFVTKPDDRIAPLYNATNGDTIENFPNTLLEVEQLSEDELRRLLDLLFVDTSGDFATLLCRFKRCCGLSREEHDSN